MGTPEQRDSASAHLVEQVVALSRNAHVNVDLEDPSDYWCRLGQRNAYAHATGLLLGRGVDQTAFEVSDRVTRALSDGETSVAALQQTAYGQQPAPAPAQAPLDWMGPVAFRANYHHAPAAAATSACAGESAATASPVRPRLLYGGQPPPGQRFMAAPRLGLCPLPGLIVLGAGHG